MDIMQTTSNNATAKRLSQMAKLYERQQASDVMTRTLEKLIDYETETSRELLGQLQRDLTGFEEQYGLSSEEFFRQFEAGKMGDDMDFIEWASLFQMAQNLQERVHLLTSED
ncbi:MAG: hypothetical protein HF973_19315 [Chloroflexi bacterium]|nr:hypothetical protein [Chloroflexota bacterium]